jgi:hypothetical protein
LPGSYLGYYASVGCQLVLAAHLITRDNNREPHHVADPILFNTNTNTDECWVRSPAGE